MGQQVGILPSVDNMRWLYLTISDEGGYDFKGWVKTEILLARMGN